MSYLTKEEIQEFERLLSIIGPDTYRLWYAMVVNGCSASMAPSGNISDELLKIMVSVDNREKTYHNFCKR